MAVININIAEMLIMCIVLFRCWTGKCFRRVRHAAWAQADQYPAFPYFRYLFLMQMYVELKFSVFRENDCVRQWIFCAMTTLRTLASILIWLWTATE